MKNYLHMLLALGIMLQGDILTGSNVNLTESAIIRNSSLFSTTDILTDEEMTEDHPNQYFIKFCHGTSQSVVDATMSELNSVELWKNDRIGLRLWAVKSIPYSCSDGDITDIDKHLARTKNKSDVAEASVDQVYLMSSNRGGNSSSSYYEYLDIYASPGSRSVKISILDSGISDAAMDRNYPSGYNYALTEYTGYDYIDNDPIPDDQNGHGTFVAGIIYNILNHEGNAPNFSFDIRKTHGPDGRGVISDLVAATLDAVDAGADIINMSFSYTDSSDDDLFDPLELAIEYARQNGVLVVTSAGNSNRNNDFGDFAPFPASLTNENILTVASNDPQSALSFFSNYGKNSVDVSILGESIPGPGLYGGLDYVSGTSFSAAIVTAMSAIMASRQPVFDYCAVKCALVQTSTPSSFMTGLIASGGVVNFREALNNPPAGCNNCGDLTPDPNLICDMNCPPETSPMNICVRKGETAREPLLAHDADGDPLSFSAQPVYGPFKGELTIHLDGSFSYTSYNGDKDMFVYQVCDGHEIAGCSDGCNQGVVYINGTGCTSSRRTLGIAQVVASSRVSAGADDAEENANTGSMYMNSSDLEMTYDPNYIRANQVIGMRFNNIDVPRGATIRSAVLRFTATDSESGSTSLLFRAHDTDHAPTFATNYRNISSRPKTSASASWNNIPAWTPGNVYTSPDVSAIVQEIVNRDGWSAGNSLAMIVTGSGERTGRSYDGSANQAPELEITYLAGVDAVAETGDKPKMLTFRYTGDGCEATHHKQDPSKVNCSGDPQAASMIYVTAVGDKTYFSDLPAPLNGTFNVDAAAIGETKLRPTTTIYLKNAQGNILQTIELHTSGSQPLGIHDQYGSLELVGYLSEKDVACGAPDMESRAIFDACKETNRNPQVLTFRYTGDHCSATRHSQDNGKVECSGSLQDVPVVFVTAKSEDKNDKIMLSNWQAPLDGLFDVDASFIGESKMKNYIAIYLSDAQGNVLQRVEIHTSCSQPLGLNDQYGALRLVGYLSDQGDLVGEEPTTSICAPMYDCDCNSKRSVIGLMYTGVEETTVWGYAKKDQGDPVGSYHNVGPGDLVVFSSLYRNSNDFSEFFIKRAGAAEVEIPTGCNDAILDDEYGDFKVVYQVDRDGNICHVPYSSCTEVSMSCGEQTMVAVIQQVTDFEAPLMMEQSTAEPVPTKEVYLYPNPAREVFYLNLKDFSGRRVDVTVYDPMSRLVRRLKIDRANEAPVEMRLNDLINGVYTVLVAPEGEQPVLKKLVIAR